MPKPNPLPLKDKHIATYERHVVRTESGCWSWNGPKNRAGYGSIVSCHYGSRHATTAHRISYMITHGHVPHELDIMHMCHNPICSNPAHLQAGTRAENMQTSFSAGRLQRRIPLSDVEYIVARRKKGETLTQIARDYNCTKQAIRHMLKTHGSSNPVTRIMEHKITHDGMTLTIDEWSQRTGLSRECIRHRIIRAGWPVEKALSKPSQR